MKISIIVPIYNIKSYIERCIESLITQTYDDLEILLVNDGSTDGSGEVIKKYEKDSRVIIINKENGGLSDARNAGMKKMTGDYVLFVDGDDFLDYDCVQLLTEEIQDHTDVIMFPYRKEYGNKSKKSELFCESWKFFREEEVREQIFARLIGPKQSIISVNPVTMDRLNTAWGKLYKSSLLVGKEFTDTGLIGPEDCWFNIQVFQNVKTVKYISSTFYHYEKQNNSSLLHRYDDDLMEKRWRMYLYIKDYLAENYENYSINLSIRIVCEQFGLILNVENSHLSQSDRSDEIKKILSDCRYKVHYENAETESFQFPWSFFYKMCIQKNYNGITCFIKLINRGICR